jgi:outer membrane protein OmpA-like peptidoglycan-associated protein
MMKSPKFLLMLMVGITLGGCSFFNFMDNQDTAKLNTFVVFFDFEKSTLNETAVKTLHQVAEQAKLASITNVNLLVHTDATGQDGSSQALSDRRTAAIKAELVKDGVPASKITSTIFREPDHLAPTADGIHEPQNRRTEIILK